VNRNLQLNAQMTEHLQPSGSQMMSTLKLIKCCVGWVTRRWQV